MSPEELTQIENEVFTRLVIDELKKQKAAGKTEFLLDKFEINSLTSERVRKIISGG